uniref:beta/gamma crystallin-related protein n=1 Tax=Brevundimonas aurantiaca TaxID=74316 RepID=UPI0017489D42
AVGVEPSAVGVGLGAGPAVAAARGDPLGGSGGGWNGGWGRTSITVYENANFRGASREFVDEDRNLGRTPFNDRISSMRVRGRWEVCTDAEFRGRCRIVEGDVRFLSDGFNDRISSMRPVRGGGRWDR